MTTSSSLPDDAKYFMAIALLSERRSKDPARQVSIQFFKLSFIIGFKDTISKHITCMLCNLAGGITCSVSLFSKCL